MPDLIELGNRRELFVDTYLIDTLHNTRLKLQEPRVANTAIQLDSPWEGEFNGGHTVIKDGDLFRMYYRGLKPEGLVHLCYAESRDGVYWTKPNLGLAEVEGTRHNNVVIADTPNYDIFLDTRPGIPVTERYKMTRYFVQGQRLTPYFAGSGVKEVQLLVSEDGLHFTEVADNPVMTCSLRNAFDSHNVFFWSAVEGQYVGYFRFFDGYRTLARVTSPDLRTWSEPVPITYGDTPREHLYTNATTAYFRAPHIYVALPARFMPGRRVVTDAQLAHMAVATSSQGQHVYYNDCSDGAFMSTRAGTNSYQRTFMEAFVRPGVGPHNWVSRTNYPLLGVVQTGPAEMSFYVSRDYAQPTWHIRRYVLRLDGFTSLNAPYAGGEMRTQPFTFTGKRLEINYSTGAAGSVRVEIQDQAGAALPGFSLADSAEIIGDEIDRIVTWGGSDDVSQLAGRAVRLRFAMHDADLFSLRFGA